jgi:sugar lactone lactonase YvrE
MKYLVYCILSILWSNFSLTGQTIYTVVGNGVSGLSGDGGPATAAKVNVPHCLAFDELGNYYFNEVLGHKIRKVTSGGVVTTCAGTGSPGFSGDGGQATAATLKFPEGLAVDAVGNLYISDHQNGRVRKIDMITGAISTFAGDGTGLDAGDGGPASTASFFPSDIRFDKRGNLYITDAFHNKIRKINSAGIISTYAGTGASGFGGDGGPATRAQLWNPATLAIDSKDNLYFTDDMNKRVRKIDTFGIINTIAGTGMTLYSGDGIPATSANLSPLSVAVDKNDNIFISDSNKRIRMIDASGIIHTMVGTGVGGYNGDAIPATSAQVNTLAGIIFDGCNNMYFIDDGNYRIRKVTYPPILTTPTISLSGASSYPAGSMVTVTATVGSAGSSYLIHWLNHGIEFTTTTLPSVTYTKPPGTDTITARIVPAGWGCWDSTTSAQHIVSTDVTGVSGVSEPWCMVYPNPAHTTLTAATPWNEGTLTIYNTIGQTVLAKQFYKRGIPVNIGNLPAGIYMLKITGAENETVITKFIKQ